LMLAASGLVAFAGAGASVNFTASALMALALVLDTADGHLARLQGNASEFGRWLDAALDELGDMALHAAAAWAAFHRDAQPAWLLLGMLYGMGKYLFQFGNGAWERGTSAGGVPRPNPAHAGALATVVRLAGHADVRWHLWIVLALCGRLDVALAAYAAYFPARALAGAVRKAAGHA
jgi:phosphatidylglycerophosphate synthase